MVVATRLDLGIALSAVAASFVVGMPLGLAAGFFGGWWDRLEMCIRDSPVKCLWAALLFGGAGALGPALQSVGIGGYYHLANAVPYMLTLVILVWTCSPRQSIRGAPAELGVSR